MANSWVDNEANTHHVDSKTCAPTNSSSNRADSNTDSHTDGNAKIVAPLLYVA
jgi:hypothetical protein